MVDDGSARLVDLDGAVTALDVTATTMMEGALRLSEAEAIAELADAFGVDPRRIATDLRAVLADLIARGTLRSGPSGLPRRAPQTRNQLASVLGALAVRLVGSRSDRKFQAWYALTAAHLSFRLAGWSPTLNAWIAPGHAGWGRTRRTTGNGNNELATLDAITVAVTRTAARYPFPLDCKDRALAAFAMARAAGLPARVVLGISLFPLALHAWCESGGRVVADQFDGYCDRYRPLRVYC
jgi:Transglutaminase-like superfamily